MRGCERKASRRGQEQLGQPRNSPWTPWKRQEQPGAARGNPGSDPGRLGRARGSPGVPRSSQQTARSHQELPGALRRRQETPGLGLASQGDPSQEPGSRSSEFTLWGSFTFYYVVEERERSCGGTVVCGRELNLSLSVVCKGARPCTASATVRVYRKMLATLSWFRV